MRTLHPRGTGLLVVVLASVVIWAWLNATKEASGPRYDLHTVNAEVRTATPPPLGPARESQRISLAEDLVLGLSETDPNNVFNYPTDVAVDKDGRIYVLDTGNYRVQVFKHNGEYLRTLGGRGEGPGDFASLTTLAVAGDLVIVADSTLNRISVWTTDGRFQGTYSNKLDGEIRNMFGTGDGTLFAVYRTVIDRNPAGLNTFNYTLGKISPEGVELLRYLVLEHSLGISVRRQMAGSVSAAVLRLGNYYPGFAVAPDGSVYASAAAEYEVAALEASGRPRWVLHADWQRKPITRDEIDHLVETSNVDMNAEGVSLVGLDRVRRHPALSDWQPISVDGHGLIYVFPHIPFYWEATDWPVDVYTPDGERIFSGTIPARTWNSVSGDFVYGTRRDPETGERAVVRWRLETPFSASSAMWEQ